jgi:hypothetical protein
VPDDDTQRILTAIEQLAANQNVMSGDIDAMRGEMNNMRGDINKMRADIMERVDRVQNTLDRTRDETVVNFANTDRAERTARAAIDDTRITPRHPPHHATSDRTVGDRR